MKTIIFAVTTVVFAAQPVQVLAQKVNDVFHFTVTHLPSSSTNAYPDVGWQQTRMNLQLNARLKLKDSTWRVFPNMGATYDQFEYTAEGRSIVKAQQLDLLSLRTGANVIKDFNKRWSVLMVAQLLLNSEAGGTIDGNDLFLNAAVAGLARLGNGWTAQLGIALNNQLGRNLIVPYFGFVHTSKSKKWMIELLFPNIHATYKPRPWLELGLSGALDATLTSVNSVQLNHGLQASFHRSQIATLGPAVGIRLSKNLWVNTRVGYTLFRRHELWDERYEPLLPETFASQNSWFARAVISYRLN